MLRKMFKKLMRDPRIDSDLTGADLWWAGLTGVKLAEVNLSGPTT